MEANEPVIKRLKCLDFYNLENSKCHLLEKHDFFWWATVKVNPQTGFG